MFYNCCMFDLKIYENKVFVNIKQVQKYFQLSNLKKKDGLNHFLRFKSK